MPFIGNKPSAVPLTSADITDGVITTAKIADGAVVNADIANSTINLTTKVTGTLPVANGGTGLATLGTAGQALVVNSGATALQYSTVGATAGQVIQVVSATDSTQRTTQSSSYVTGSNTLSATITPSSSSNKILIMLCTVIARDDGNSAYWTIYRGGSNLFTADGIFIKGREDDANIDPTPLSFHYLDSPATTSSTTYQVYMKSNAAIVAYLNVNSPKNSITLMEIKG
jgi:hypothetical protein